MPDDIPPTKPDLPITDSVEIFRHSTVTPPMRQRAGVIAIRSDGFVVIDGKREDIARSYLALCAAARACGQALARAELAEAVENASLVSEIQQTPPAVPQS